MSNAIDPNVDGGTGWILLHKRTGKDHFYHQGGFWSTNKATAHKFGTKKGALEMKKDFDPSVKAIKVN